MKWIFLFFPTLLFADSLNTFITLALENNPELIIEKYQLNKQEVSLKKAKKAEFYPEISLSLTTSLSKETVELKDEEGKEYKQTTKTKEKPTLEAITGISRPHPLGGKLKLNLKLSDVIDEKDKEKGELSIESEEPISLYQRKVIKEPLLDEKEDLLLSEISLNKKIEETIYNVISSYCELQRLSSSIIVKENEFNDLMGTLEIAKAKLEKGIIPELDLFQISLQLKSSEIELSGLRREREEKEIRFLQLLGIKELGERIEKENWEKRIERLKGLKIMEDNLEIKIKEIEIERLKRGLKEAKSKNSPIFIPSWTIIKEKERKEEKIGLSLKFYLYDKGIKKEEIKIQEASLKQEEISLQSLVSDIKIEISERENGIKDKEKRILVLKENIQLAEKIYEITKIKQERGLIFSKEMLEAEQDVTKQKNELINQEIGLFLDYIELKKLKGGLYNAYQENLF
ncbi:MAG: TolC family protein [bacterium]